MKKAGKRAKLYPDDIRRGYLLPAPANRKRLRVIKVVQVIGYPDRVKAEKIAYGAGAYRIRAIYTYMFDTPSESVDRNKLYIQYLRQYLMKYNIY